MPTFETKPAPAQAPIPRAREPVLDERAIQSLAASVRGAIVRRGDPGYDELRRVWNGMIDKHPALIVRCAGTSDVVGAVDFARSRGLLVAVRGKGHNVAGNAVCDGGLVIDLSTMTEVQVDPAARIARVQPGAGWGDVDRATQAYGLATPGGQVSTTGIAGFTLGGGMGFLRRKWGLACDNLIGAQVVLADGRVVRTSETENPDLLWGLRGGGGNFGIVTSFEYRLHPLGPTIYFAGTIYPASEAHAVLRGWQDYLSRAPDEVTADVLLWGMPPLPMVPKELHGAPIVLVAALYAGPPDEGERVLAPLRALGKPLADLSGRMPYAAMQSNLDPLFPEGMLCYWKSLTLDQLTDETLDAIVHIHGERPTPQTLLALRGLGGAMGRVPEDATAYGNRSAAFNLSIDTTWFDPAASEHNIAWTRAIWSEMHDRAGGGIYVNFAGFGEENRSIAEAAHGRNYARLVELKRRYDPTNFFHLNINIEP